MRRLGGNEALLMWVVIGHGMFGIWDEVVAVVATVLITIALIAFWRASSRWEAELDEEEGVEE
jgi:hypothetical protein